MSGGIDGLSDRAPVPLPELSQADAVLVHGLPQGAIGEAINEWCQLEGWRQYPDAWALEVTVSHYPTGCSKWNPIEHRLFSRSA